jgi:hypothetical protein
MILLTMGSNLDNLSDQPFSTRNQFQNDQISLSNPHHVAIRIVFYAPPRCFSAENSGAGGHGFPHNSEEKNGNKFWSFPHNCEEIEAYSRYVWANSLNVSS